ncbi:MAG: AI-2E family transporter [Nocardioidaceae bacterium]
MNRIQRAIDAMRSRARADVEGQDDERGVVAAPLPDPSLAATPDAGIPRPDVPWAVNLAAAWSWRLLVIGAAIYVAFRISAYFSEITVPLAIGVLLTALAAPLINRMDNVGVPRGISAALVVLGGLAVVIGMLTLVGTQVSSQFSELRVSLQSGLTQIEDWLRTGPLHISQAQLSNGIDQLKAAVRGSGSGQVVDKVTSVGGTVTRVLAGLFIVLFATYFFSYQGSRIWDWIVRIFPRAAREAVDSSGRVAWVTLTAFVRATVLVAFTDAVGIAGAALVLRVPLVLAIGVLVFLGAFIPVIGAFLSGTVAVLVALVDRGYVTALILLGAVVLVQQLEAHVLQPFLMGRFVSLHPLGIIISIAAGVTVSGVIGALIAVPLVACGNAVVGHLSNPPPPAPPPRRPAIRPRQA